MKSKSFSQSVGFIGTGNMASALIAGMIKSKTSPKNIFAYDIDRSQLKKIKSELKIQITSSLKEICENASLLVIAVKPQNFSELIKALSSLTRNHLLISIAAGIETKTIKKLGNKVVRAMPNNPALIGEGITALYTPLKLNKNDLSKIEKIFKGSGEILWVKNESELDGVTGLSGSGPAYLYRFVKALSLAGEKVGLKKSDAYRLALKTVVGAALTLQKTGKHPAELIPLVTSKGGTTLAGLNVLDSKKFDEIILETVRAATKRAKELKNGYE